MSLSLESQPPGPSGLNLYQLPTATSAGPSGSGVTTAQGNGGGVGSSASSASHHGDDAQTTTPFLVPPSQDILRSQASQEGDGLGLGSLFSKPVVVVVVVVCTHCDTFTLL